MKKKKKDKKEEIRVLGIDDAPFKKTDTEVLVVGTFFRGGKWLDGVLSTKIEKDGEEATFKLIQMVNQSRFRKQLQTILLDGLTLGGFNVIDIKTLSKETQIPVIVVMRKKPNFLKLKKTLENLKMGKKYLFIKQAGNPREVRLTKGKIFIQFSGIVFEEAKEIIKICCTRSYLPEAIRVAHLIGAGIIKGESKGKA